MRRLYLIALFSFCLSSFSYANTHYPISIKDGSGATVTLTQAPKNIASKSMFGDQVLLALLPHSQISSLTTLSDDPSYSIIANAIPSGIPLTDLNIETLLAEKPDLVIAANWSDKQKIALLRQSGITVFIPQTAYTIRDIEHNIATIGTLINQSQAANHLIQSMNQTLKTQLIVPKKPLSVVELTPWGAASNQDSTINTIFSQAGLNNLLAHTQGDHFGQVPLSKEQLLVLNPDVLVIPGTIDPKTGQLTHDFKQQILSDPAYQTLNAVKNKRIIELPQPLRSTDSQYIVDAIIYLNHRVYGG